MKIPGSRPAVSAFALSLALAACGDRGPVSPATPAPTSPAAPVVLAAVQCQASTAARTVSCAQGALPTSARGYVIVGGQGAYVQLTSSNVSYNGGTGIFSFDETVQNLIPQPMATTDGATADGAGVRVIFHSGPNVTAGSGSVTVANATGTGTFTGTNQPYFAYAGGELGADGILSQNETSAAKTWQLAVTGGVTTFSFVLYVVAEVPHPNGYVDVTPGADSVLAGATATLSATVRSAVGNPLAGQTVTWGSDNTAVATVDASGQVTAVAPRSPPPPARAAARPRSPSAPAWRWARRTWPTCPRGPACAWAAARWGRSTPPSPST